MFGREWLTHVCKSPHTDTNVQSFLPVASFLQRPAVLTLSHVCSIHLIPLIEEWKGLTVFLVKYGSLPVSWLVFVPSDAKTGAKRNCYVKLPLIDVSEMRVSSHVHIAYLCHDTFVVFNCIQILQ